jgi:hypothetical protein
VYFLRNFPGIDFARDPSIFIVTPKFFFRMKPELIGIFKNLASDPIPMVKRAAFADLKVLFPNFRN